MRVKNGQALFRYWPVIRLVAFVALLALTYWIAATNGWLEQADPRVVRDLAAQWSTWGVLFFLLIFTVGQICYVPGSVFVVGAALAYGQVAGFAIAMVGAMIAATVCFYFARGVGGKPLENMSSTWVGHLIRHLDERPVRNIFLLRLFMGTAPVVHYLLGMSGVGIRHYMVGSFLGMLIPVAFWVLFMDWLIIAIFGPAQAG